MSNIERGGDGQYKFPKSFADVVAGVEVVEPEYEKRERIALNVLQSLYAAKMEKVKGRYGGCFCGWLEARNDYISGKKRTCFGEGCLFLYYEERVKGFDLPSLPELHNFEKWIKNYDVRKYRDLIESDKCYALCSLHYRIFRTRNFGGGLNVMSSGIDLEKGAWPFTSQVLLYDPQVNIEGFAEFKRKNYPRLNAYYEWLDSVYFCSRCGINVNHLFEYAEANYDLCFVFYDTDTTKRKDSIPSLISAKRMSKKNIVKKFLTGYPICLQCDVEVGGEWKFSADLWESHLTKNRCKRFDMDATYANECNGSYRVLNNSDLYSTGTHRVKRLTRREKKKDGEIFSAILKEHKTEMSRSGIAASHRFITCDDNGNQVEVSRDTFFGINREYLPPPKEPVDVGDSAREPFGPPVIPTVAASKYNLSARREMAAVIEREREALHERDLIGAAELDAELERIVNSGCYPGETDVDALEEKERELFVKYFNSNFYEFNFKSFRSSLWERIRNSIGPRIEAHFAVGLQGYETYEEDIGEKFAEFFADWIRDLQAGFKRFDILGGGFDTYTEEDEEGAVSRWVSSRYELSALMEAWYQQLDESKEQGSAVDFGAGDNIMPLPSFFASKLAGISAKVEARLEVWDKELEEELKKPRKKGSRKAPRSKARLADLRKRARNKFFHEEMAKPMVEFFGEETGHRLFKSWIKGRNMYEQRYMKSFVEDITENLLKLRKDKRFRERATAVLKNSTGLPVHEKYKKLTPRFHEYYGERRGDLPVGFPHFFASYVQHEIVKTASAYGYNYLRHLAASVFPDVPDVHHADFILGALWKGKHWRNLVVNQKEDVDEALSWHFRSYEDLPVGRLPYTMIGCFHLEAQRFVLTSDETVNVEGRLMEAVVDAAFERMLRERKELEYLDGRSQKRTISVKPGAVLVGAAKRAVAWELYEIVLDLMEQGPTPAMERIIEKGFWSHYANDLNSATPWDLVSKRTVVGPSPYGLLLQRAWRREQADKMRMRRSKVCFKTGDKLFCRCGRCEENGYEVVSANVAVDIGDEDVATAGLSLGVDGPEAYLDGFKVDSLSRSDRVLLQRIEVIDKDFSDYTFGLSPEEIVVIRGDGIVAVSNLKEYVSALDTILFRAREYVTSKDEKRREFIRSMVLAGADHDAMDDALLRWDLSWQKEIVRRYGSVPSKEGTYGVISEDLEDEMVAMMERGDVEEELNVDEKRGVAVAMAEGLPMGEQGALHVGSRGTLRNGDIDCPPSRRQLGPMPEVLGADVDWADVSDEED